MAIHNIPEGLAVAVVLIPRGVSLMSSMGWSIFSNLPQPLIAVPIFHFVSHSIPWMPVGMGFAAGAMIYVALFELLFEALETLNRFSVFLLVLLSASSMLVLQQTVSL